MGLKVAGGQQGPPAEFQLVRFDAFNNELAEGRELVADLA
jgi:hypothetical protein